MQYTFNPLDYGFEWDGDWYTFDHRTAHRAALKARNAKARQLAQEYPNSRILKYAFRDQLVSRGGIGSGHPHIELIVTAYAVEVV